MSDLHHQTATRHPDRLGRYATAAILGNGILLATAWLLPLASEFTLLGDSISELALGRSGVVLTTAFLLAGSGTVGLAVAIRELTGGAGNAVLGSVLVGLYGAGAILSAIFPTDRVEGVTDLGGMSTSGTIHVIVSLGSFVCVVAGMVVLTWRFRKLAAWRSLTPWSALLATAAVSLLLGQTQGPLLGLMQRLLVTAIAAWLVLVAFRIRNIIATAPESRPH